MSDSVAPPLIEDAGFRLHRAAMLNDRLTDHYLRSEWQISAAHFWLLLTVGLLDQPTQRQIATELGVSRASVTQRVRSLTTAGLVTVFSTPADRRANRVALTERGARRLADAWQGLNSHQSTILLGIDEHTLLRQLGLLIDNAESQLRAAETASGDDRS
ncbi:MarR family winged helix-turn-helix transcriptional regulator [Pseudoclavibacter soli]|uniref:MarR family winged helix-turn-helix transcriptional regulator n=1 Tax=Pseudoclavibacter soli TaxID=452623 RepID=UPI00040FCCC0|nr:MarR family winged helix-turn-helix transcriptional regulator [Pseudoclavibacter soli]